MTSGTGSSLRAGLRERYTAWRNLTGAWAARHGRFAAALHEFVVFGIKQAWACLFGGLMVALILASHLWYPAGAPLARYDALTIAAVLSFTLIALFIWLAENIGTFTHTWLYPNQMQGWELVSTAKLGAWFLLTIMSYVMVTLVNPPRPVDGASDASGA